LGDIDINDMIILKRLLKKYGVRFGILLFWLIIRSNVGYCE